MSASAMIERTFNDKSPTVQIEIFRGEENMVTLNQTHSKMFHCTYLLHYYPFDTQEHCFVILLQQ